MPRRPASRLLIYADAARRRGGVMLEPLRNVFKKATVPVARCAVPTGTKLWSAR